MMKSTVKWITAILTRLLYLMLASVLLVALLITIEHGLPPALRSRLASPSQAANLHTEDGAWTTYDTSNSGLVSDYVLSMHLDEEWRGRKWFGSTSGVSKLDGVSWTTFDTSNSGLAHNRVNAIATDAEGSKWFGTNGGVSKFDGAAWTTYDTSNSGLASNNVSAIAMDHSGNVWIGTFWHGISKFDGVNWTIYDTSNSGLAGDSINAITVGHAGRVWIGTSTAGVSKFDGANWTTYDTSNSGLVSNHVRSIAIDDADVKWFGGCLGGEWSPGVFGCDTAAVTRFDGSAWTIYMAGFADLVGSEVKAIAIDQEGNKWFGSSDAGVSKFDGAAWTTYDASNSELQSDHITSIAVDNQGSIWFGTYGGGVSKYHLPSARLSPGKKIQIPRIDKGEGWDTHIQVQNVGDAQTGVVILFWGDYSAQCASNEPGPVTHLCHRIPGKWATWAVKDLIPAEAKSAILYSVSDDVFEAACQAAGDYEAWRSWEATYAYGGGPLAVTIDRLAYNGNPASSMYHGFSETMLSYQYFAPHVTHGYNGLDSTITIQNSGDYCTSIWLYYKEEGNCEYMKVQHIEQIAPGEAIHIGPGPDADLAFPSPELDAPWLGSTYITANEPLAIVVDRWNASSTMLLTHAGFPYIDYGATTNYVPLIYRNFDGWDAEIHVQNLTQESQYAFVTVEFFDQSGDHILYLGEWICRNGTATFDLSDILDLGVNFPFGYVGAAEIQSHGQVDYPGQPSSGPPIASVVSLINSTSGQALSHNALTPQQVKGVTTFAFPLVSKQSQGYASDVVQAGNDVTSTSVIALRNNSDCNRFWGKIWMWDETGASVGGIDVPWLHPKHLKIIDLRYQGWLYSGFVGAATFEVLGVEQLCDEKGDGYVDNEPIMPSVVVLNGDANDSVSGQEAFPIKDSAVAGVVVKMTPFSPVKAEAVEFEVAFSQQMNTAVAPVVTMGVNFPYTDYAIAPRTGTGYTNGYLNSDSTKWYGAHTFTDTTGDGMYHVSVAGAEDVFGNPIATDRRNMFILDTAPPSSSVTDLPAYQSGLSFSVSWSGSDATSGIASWDVQYRDGAGPWTDWLIEATETSATFTGEDGHTYHFQSRARDNAGNVEDYPGGDGDTHTTVDVPAPILSEVRVTNVRDTSFTVSWTTDVDANGEVHYGTDPSALNQIAYDDCGAGTLGDTHYVTLQVWPQTTYYFDVISGATTDDNGGAHYNVITGPTLELPGSDTIYGQAFQEDGTTPAEGTIVYITLRDADGSGSPGEAATLSALVDSSGYWYTNLGNARTADLGDYFDYTDGDWVLLKAQGAADGMSCLAVATTEDAPVVPIALNLYHCTWPIYIQIGWNHISLPLVPLTPYTAEGVCNEINRRGGDVVEIDRWYAGGWDGHICGLPFNDFNIKLGSDYFIKSNAVSIWTIEGYEVMTPVQLCIQVGWNSIGIPHTDAYTTESLCEQINAQCGDGTVVECDRWYAGGWDGHICGLPFNDFPVEIGTGYFVKAAKACCVTLSSVE